MPRSGVPEGEGAGKTVHTHPPTHSQASRPCAGPGNKKRGPKLGWSPSLRRREERQSIQVCRGVGITMHTPEPR